MDGPGMALPVGHGKRTGIALLRTCVLTADPYPAPVCPFIDAVSVQIAFAFFCI